MNTKKLNKVSVLFTVFAMLCSLFCVPTQGSIQTVSAAAVERTEVEITKFSIEHRDGTTGNKYEYWETVNLKMSWDASMYENDLKAGDYFTVKLPDAMYFPANQSTKSFSVVDGKGHVVATAVVSPKTKGGGTIRVTFTKYVEKRHNIKGSLSLASEFVYEKISTNGLTEFEISVNGKVKDVTIDVTNPTVDPDEVFHKWPYHVEKPEEVGWTLRLNYSKGQKYTNLKISDQLIAKKGSLAGIHYIDGTFILRRVKVSTTGDVIQVYETRNVSKDIKFNADKTAFTYNFGTLNKNDQYVLDYKTTYVPGVELTNKANFVSDTYSTSTEGYYKEAVSNGTGQGDYLSQIKIIKIDAKDQQKRLAGAGFKITNLINHKVFNVTTDANGEAVLEDLLPGQYEIEEVVVPAGYILDATPKMITVASGEVRVETISNVLIAGKIEITKQDEATKALLAGAEFDVKDINGNIVDHIITDSTGVATTKDLPLGDYTLVETKAPAGYVLDTTPLPVTIATHEQVVKISRDNKRAVGKIELTKQDKATQTKLAGAEFDVVDVNGNVVDHIITGSTGVATTKDLPLGDYALVETKAPKGYELDATPIKVTIGTHGEVVKISADNVMTSGKIELTKQDKATAAKLATAEFDVKDKDGNIVDHIVTDSTGVATTKNLPLGDYTLVETKAPAGYELDATPIKVTIGMHGEVVKVTKDNVQSVGKIELLKKDRATKALLAGAEFDVLDANGNLVDHIITDSNGVATTKDLPLGDYTLVETKAPVGYEIDTTIIPATITTHGELVKVAMDNIQSAGKIELTKQDKATAIKLASAEFDVKDKDGNVVDHITTDANGIATTRELPLGDYTLVETKAPKGYELDATPIKATIGTHGEIVKVTMDNIQSVGKIELTKQDKATQAKLADAEFDVKDKDGKIVDHIVTDTTGVATTKELPLGDYTLVETKAPVGYELDATPIQIIIGAHNQVVKITKDNVKSAGKIELTKQDKATKAMLTGAEFDVKDKDGNVVDHIVTGSTGVATTKELPLGEYTLVETKAPVGYELDVTPIKVTIGKHAEVIKVAMDNVQSVGKIELTKTDKATQAKLASAEFDVKDKDGKIVDHITTDENGVAITKELPLGDYTLVETKAPKGYTLDTTPLSVKVGTHGEIVKVSMVNKLAVGKIVVSKFDKATGARLSGMVFKVRNTETGLEQTIEMKTNNVMEVLNLPLGTYEIIEVTAPAGYELDSTVHTLIIEKDGDVKELKMYDTHTPPTPPTPPTPDKPTLPKTGAENNEFMLIVGAMFVTISTVFIFYRKRIFVK